MVEVGQHPRITLRTYSEVEEVSGSVGNYTVKVRRKSPYVDWEKCNGCGECDLVCPVSLNSEFDRNLTTRRAIYRPFPQAVPNKYTISKRGQPPCRIACPAGVNVQGYIALIRMGKYKEALELEREANPFASVCGRVCNHPCESSCVRGEVDEPIAIASLKRFIADVGSYPLEQRKPDGDRIAVVGAGPGGLSCAYFLAKKNYQVTVYEAEERAGGMLVLGIPAFRLPRDATKADIDYITSFGVAIKTGVKVGEAISIDDLKHDYRAVFLATGAYEEMKLNVEGEDLDGVIHCINFLRKVNLGEKVTLGQKVVIIGGGNAAVDAARVAKRLGSEVTILYRRSRTEMPANAWEVDEAEKEGITIEFLTAPTKILGTEQVQEIECIRMELGSPDASGRRRPIPIAGSEFTIPIDNVIVAISQKPQTDWLGDEFERTKWDTLVVDSDTLETTVSGVYAGGDVVSGPATIIEAVAAGKKAAEAIDAHIRGITIEHKQPREGRPEPETLKSMQKISRIEMPKLATSKRKGFDEVERGFDEEMAKKEAERCLNCALCCECLQCDKVCEPQAIVHDLEDTVEEYNVGAIIVATGYELYPIQNIIEYGSGLYEDVIDGLQFERLLSASGPTEGEIRRPSDGKIPKRVAFICCVGSRDPEHHLSYCSKICCMYNAKHALLYKEHVSDGEAIIFAIDVRTAGKGYEEFFTRAKEEGKVIYIKGKPARIIKEGDQLAVWSIDTLTGRHLVVKCDMVVLAMAVVPGIEARELAQKLRIQTNVDGFFTEAHPKLRPVESLVPGFFLAGCAQAPKDIPEVVAQASGAASKVLEMFSKKEIVIEPMIAAVDEDLCCGCKVCITTCPYDAREFDEEKNIVTVNEALCMGCGACIAACPSGASQQKNFADRQILKMVEVILE
jgi:heterodisulfide reductase subunit A